MRWSRRRSARRACSRYPHPCTRCRETDGGRVPCRTVAASVASASPAVLGEIPAVAKSGTRGGSSQGRGGHNAVLVGDLFVVVDSSRPSLYERRLSDLVRVPVTYAYARSVLRAAPRRGPVSGSPDGTDSGKTARPGSRVPPQGKRSRRPSRARERHRPKKLTQAERERARGYSRVSREDPRHEGSSENRLRLYGVLGGSWGSAFSRSSSRDKEGDTQAGKSRAIAAVAAMIALAILAAAPPTRSFPGHGGGVVPDRPLYMLSSPRPGRDAPQTLLMYSEWLLARAYPG